MTMKIGDLVRDGSRFHLHPGESSHVGVIVNLDTECPSHVEIMWHEDTSWEPKKWLEVVNKKTQQEEK